MHESSLYRCGRTIGHLTVGDFAVTGVPLLLFSFLLTSREMNGKPKADGLVLPRVITIELLH